MKRRTFLKAVPAYAVLAGAATSITQDAGTSSSAALEPIELIKPETDGGKSVLAALKERQIVMSAEINSCHICLETIVEER